MVSNFFWFCLNLSVSEKLKNSIFEMLIITQDLNINNLRTRSGKSINLHIIKKVVDYSLKDVAAKVMFIFIVLQILLSEGRSLLWPSQRGTAIERVKVLVKNIVNLLKFLEKWLNYKLTSVWNVFKFFSFYLTLSVREKLKNLIFEMPIVSQTSNINNLRTTSANSFNLHMISKLVEYSLKNVGKRQRLFLPFWRCCCPKIGR